MSRIARVALLARSARGGPCARRRTRRHLPRLRLRGGRRELGQPLVVGTGRERLRGRHGLHTGRRARRAPDRRREGDRQRRVGRADVHEPGRARRSPTSASAGCSTTTRTRRSRAPARSTRSTCSARPCSRAPATTTSPPATGSRRPAPGTAIPQADASFSRRTNSLRQFGALAGYRGRRAHARDPRRLLPADDELLRTRRRPRVPRALRDGRHGERSHAPGADRARRGPARGRGAERLGPGAPERDRQRRRPPRGDRGRHRSRRRSSAPRTTAAGRGRRPARAARSGTRGRAPTWCASRSAPPRCRPAGAPWSSAPSTRAATRSIAARSRSTSPRRRTAAR